MARRVLLLIESVSVTDGTLANSRVTAVVDDKGKATGPAPEMPSGNLLGEWFMADWLLVSGEAAIAPEPSGVLLAGRFSAPSSGGPAEGESRGIAATRCGAFPDDAGRGNEPAR